MSSKKQTTMITLENYEEWMCLHVDGELDAAQTQALMAFVAEHPELKDELALFEATKLKPETKLIFDQKEQLLQPKTISFLPFNHWKTFSAAAGLALLLGFGAQQILNKTIDSSSTVAQTIKPNKINRKSVPFQTESITKKIKKSVKYQNNPVPETQDHQALKPENEIDEISALTKIEISESRFISETKLDLLQPKKVQHEENILLAFQEEEKLNWLNALPIGDEKKEGIKIISASVLERWESLKATKNKITNTQFALKIGNKNIIHF